MHFWEVAGAFNFLFLLSDHPGEASLHPPSGEGNSSLRCKVEVAGRVGLGAQTAPLSFHWYRDKWRDFSVAHFCGVEKVSPPRHDWVEGPRIEVTNGELWSASRVVIHWAFHHSIREPWNGGDLTWSSSSQELPNVLGAWKFQALRYFLCS